MTLLENKNKFFGLYSDVPFSTSTKSRNLPLHV